MTWQATSGGPCSAAVAFLKAGDDLRCVAAFAKLFRKVRDNHLIHKELYVCHSNRQGSPRHSPQAPQRHYPHGTHIIGPATSFK